MLKYHKLGTELSSQVFYSLSIVILFENSLEKVSRLLLFLIRILKGYLGCKYTKFLEALRPALLILCYNTEANGIITIISRNIVNTLLRHDAGNLSVMLETACDL